MARPVSRCAVRRHARSPARAARTAWAGLAVRAARAGGAEITAKFVSAWEAADLDALVALLTDDVFMAMPPMPIEYEGRDLVRRFSANIFGAGRRFELIATRANGRPAFGVYLRGVDGIRRAAGLYVLTLSGDRICGSTRFERGVLAWFGLPAIVT